MTCCVEFSLPIQIQDDADRITENLRQFMAEDAPDATWRVAWFDPMETAACRTMIRTIRGMPTWH
jgi:hypothetical protein